MSSHPGHPRVAVLTPCFNDGATLGEAVKSVQTQDEPCELVVVDDGSSEPKTLAVLADLEARGVHVLHQRNAGPGAARNAGLSATTAQYVIPIDADDRLAPGAIKALADALDADPSLTLAWGDVELFGDQSGVMRKADALDPWMITYINELPIATLVRRQDLVAVGGWRARGYEDWALWMALAGRGARGIRVPVTTLEYRVHSQRNGSRDFAAQERLIDELRHLHSDLYARRGTTWRRSEAPLLLRLTLPLIEHLPLSAHRTQAIIWIAGDAAYGRLRTTVPARLARQANTLAPLLRRLRGKQARTTRRGG